MGTYEEFDNQVRLAIGRFAGVQLDDEACQSLRAAINAAAVERLQERWLPELVSVAGGKTKSTVEMVAENLKQAEQIAEVRPSHAAMYLIDAVSLLNLLMTIFQARISELGVNRQKDLLAVEGKEVLTIGGTTYVRAS